MKYNITLVLLFFAIFTIACKKGSNPAPAPDANQVIKTQITGNWQLIDQKFTYYDKAGTVIKTGTLTADIDQKWEFASNGTVNSADTRGKRSYQYAINAVNGKQQLNLKGNGDDILYDVSINGDMMSWGQEELSDKNPDYYRVVAVYHLKKI